MKHLTIVEEVGIIQPFHMLHILRLSHGHYGTTDNTSRVWQTSKLHADLPNLSSTCKYACIQKISNDK